MTRNFVARLAAPALLLVAGAAEPAVAQNEDFRVVGTHSPASTWRASVARDISANLTVPRLGFAQPPEGIVKVAFHVDASGRVDQVSVNEPSNSPVLNHAAVTAINRMRTVRPAPAGMSESRSIEAWLYFANTDGVAERYQAQLRHMAHPDLAANEQGTAVVVGVRG